MMGGDGEIETTEDSPVEEIPSRIHSWENIHIPAKVLVQRACCPICCGIALTCAIFIALYLWTLLSYGPWTCSS